jgi:leucyl aminopeptidase
VADLRNTQADPYGGAIAAALFLEEFAGETAWAHLDIAGPAFHDKRTDVGPRGATGYGITTLVRYLENLARGR